MEAETFYHYRENSDYEYIFHIQRLIYVKITNQSGV